MLENIRETKLLQPITKVKTLLKLFFIYHATKFYKKVVQQF